MQYDLDNKCVLNILLITSFANELLKIEQV